MKLSILNTLIDCGRTFIVYASKLVLLLHLLFCKDTCAFIFENCAVLFFIRGICYDCVTLLLLYFILLRQVLYPVGYKLTLYGLTEC
jgi:hypothetical protein